jgi:hypothetical protein
MHKKYPPENEISASKYITVRVNTFCNRTPCKNFKLTYAFITNCRNTP